MHPIGQLNFRNPPEPGVKPHTL